MEEILPNLYRIEIPLPETPLKSLNSYVIKGEERNLIIDTGLNRKECLEAMNAGLNELDIDLAKTDIFITHLHADHFGLVSSLATSETEVFFNRGDAEIIEAGDGLERAVNYSALNGFPDNDLRNALRSHPGYKYFSSWIPDFKILNDGELIQVGDFCFECVITPGHSSGHTCLYDAVHKMLIAGDHILQDITPNIQCWSENVDPLGDYLNSLEKVSKMDINLVLPGHRKIFRNPAKRIKELKNHHRERLEEVLSILSKKSLNAYQVASHMCWNINAKNWDLFPVAQKLFATGEAIAHLIYLYKREIISQTTEGKVKIYSIKG